MSTQLVSKNPSNVFIQDIRNSLLFTQDWDLLLSAAPLAITSLGACAIAASADGAQLLKLAPPVNGFKKLEHNSLRAALLQCFQGGRDSFKTLALKMQGIEDDSNYARRATLDIMTILQSEEPGEIENELPHQMKLLAKTAEKCQSHATAMEASVETWKELVEEILRSMEQTATEKAERKAEIKGEEESKTKLRDGAQKGVDTWKESVETMKGVLTTTSEAYKKASDEYPTGWELVGQEAVLNLTSTFSKTISSIVPMAVDAKLNGGRRTLSKVLQNEDSDEEDNSPKAKKRKSKKSKYPDDYNDPAYRKVDEVKTPMDLLEEYVSGGKDDTFDWDNIKKGALSSTLKSLTRLQKDFKPSKKKPSIQLSEALTLAIETAQAIQAVLEDSTVLGSTKRPAADDPKVLKWQKDIRTAHAKVLKLCAASSSLPGNSVRQLPAPKSSESSGDTDTGSHSTRVLKAANERLEIAQQAYSTAQQNYLDTSKSLVEATNRLEEIRGELAKLDVESKNLEKIAEVLQSCLGILYDLDAQIQYLRNFFGALAALVKAAVEGPVKEFVDYLKEQHGKISSEKRFGGFTFSQFQQGLIFRLSLTMRGYFSVFRDVAAMYKKIHTEHLDEGLRTVSQMNIPLGPDALPQLREKQKKLQEWSSGAIQGVGEIGKRMKGEVMSALEARVQAIREEQSRLKLPPLSNRITDAINEGAKEILESTTTAITANKLTVVTVREKIQQTPASKKKNAFFEMPDDD